MPRPLLKHVAGLSLVLSTLTCLNAPAFAQPYEDVPPPDTAPWPPEEEPPAPPYDGYPPTGYEEPLPAQEPPPSVQYELVPAHHRDLPGYRVPILPPRPTYFALRAFAAAVGADRVLMAGLGGALRWRPWSFLAGEVSLGIFSGRDYNGLDRVEIPLTFDALVFFTPQWPLQFYAVLSVGGAWAHTQGFHEILDITGFSRDMVYLGGALGLGVEWRFSPWFALHSDVRAFMRHRLGGGEAEFFKISTGESSDLSAGALLQVGGLLYF